jgi:hypothetical protein
MARNKYGQEPAVTIRTLVGPFKTVWSQKSWGGPMRATVPVVMVPDELGFRELARLRGTRHIMDV